MEEVGGLRGEDRTVHGLEAFKKTFKNNYYLERCLDNLLFLFYPT